MNLPKTETVKGRRTGFVSAVVDFVCSHDDRLAAAPQLVGDDEIVFEWPRCSIYDKDDNISGFDRELRLLRYPCLEPTRAGLQSPGVEDLECATTPLGSESAAIARDAGRFLYDRLAPADDAIHKRRLPDVGAADHGDDRQTFHRALHRPLRCRTRSTTASTASASVMCVESMVTASGAGTSGDSERDESAASRASI